MAMMERKKKGVDLEEIALGEIIRELTDHVSKTKRDEYPKQAHRTWTNTSGGEKRKFNSWRDHYEGDGCAEKCNWCIIKFKRLGHGHIEGTCRKKDPSKWPPAHPNYKPPGSFVVGKYIPQRNTGEDANKKFVTINDVKVEEKSSKRHKAASIARVMMTRQVDQKGQWQYDSAATCSLA
jgi:hypothetical protein